MTHPLEDLDAWRKKAEAADHRIDDEPDYPMSHHVRQLTVTVERAGFIAASSPDRVIALIDEVERLRTDYSDHLVVYQSLLDEQKKSEDLEAQVAKLREENERLKVSLITHSDASGRHLNRLCVVGIEADKLRLAATKAAEALKTAHDEFLEHSKRGSKCAHCEFSRNEMSEALAELKKAGVG